jgi:hypothetical protein
MPRSFDLSADYDGSVEEVHRAFTHEDYWRARLAESGVDVGTLESMRVGDDDTVEVVTLQVIRSENLPGMVTQLHSGDLCIRREESWGPVSESDGSAQGSVLGSILEAPVNLTGEAALSPIRETGGTRLVFRATVQVRVPIIGGKLENIIGARLAELVEAEQRFTTKWIAERA